MDIPGDLVDAVAEQRVIPFLGAGFSSAVGLPNWETLLAKLATETEGSLPFADLKRYTNNDYLQMAEYLYLKCDQRIGPIRHVLERGLPSSPDILSSPAHVELVNLGAPQIYTTNYDDLIETTYRTLDMPVNVVALGRDVANAGQQATQVVKYHGDLRHESTLVLTESSYYKRLDFESPMDVKFRADLLGKSVLFMGYSFRDINIRLIWFKLNQMMEEIPTADRRQSYIVRMEPNPVLEALYEAVGLKTLVLDGPGAEGRPDRLGRRRIPDLGEFLSQLALLASRDGTRPGTVEPMVAGKHVIDAAEAEIQKRSEADRQWEFAGQGLPFMQRLLSSSVPKEFQDRASEVVVRALRPGVLPTWDYVSKAIASALQSNAIEAVSKYVLDMLSLGEGFVFSERIRDQLLSSALVPWPQIWECMTPDDVAAGVRDRLAREIEYNEGGNADRDIAYAAFMAKQVVSGWLGKHLENEELRQELDGLIERVADIYPSVSDLKPTEDGPPSIGPLLAEVDARRRQLGEHEDPPF